MTQGQDDTEEGSGRCGHRGPKQFGKSSAQLTKQLQRQQGTINAIQTNPWEICESCGRQHSTTECQSSQMTVEQV